MHKINKHSTRKHTTKYITKKGGIEIARVIKCTKVKVKLGI